MERQDGGRTVLEWVTCPGCSTTFRVAVPAHYDRMEIEYDLEEASGAYQIVICADADCDREFYLSLE